MPDTRRLPDAATPPLLRVAHVRRVHGVRGEVRAQALGGDVGRFAPGTVLISERDRRPLRVASSRPLDGDELLLSFDELPVREEAARLTGTYLCVERWAARPLAADEWFVWQLVGLRAVSDTGADLGVVIDVEDQPSSAVLVVRDAAGERRFPLVRQWVRSVDVDAGVVVVTPWTEADD